MQGKLFVVATPIGNLDDITLRALKVLKEVDLIACENRNRHLKLLNYFEIKKRLIEVSPSNEKNSANGILRLLEEGKQIALVSDAGVPAVSDPGRFVIRTAVEAGFDVVPVPGVSALTTLSSVSGLPNHRILFLGFLSKKVGKISRELEHFRDFEGMIVIFVSRYQIKKLLKIINQIFENADTVIGREMTKVNESFLRGKPAELLEMDFPEKGEFSVAVFPSP